RLERRARRIGAADGAVERRRARRIAIELREVLRVVRGELLAEGRVARDRLDRARVRVHRDRRAAGRVVAGRPGVRHPVLDGLDRGALETGVDGELQRRRLLLRRDPERAGDPPERVDGDLRLHEAVVEDRVVRRLDAALPDDLAGLGYLVRVRLELVRRDLAEQSEELAAEGPERIAPRRLDLDLEAREPVAPLLQIVGERGARVGDDDGGSEGGVVDVARDRADEPALAQPREAGETPDRLQAGWARAPDAVGVAAAERRCVRVDDDVPAGSREQPAAIVDDRSPRADQVDDAVRLPLRLVGVLPAVEDLDRPGAQQEERKSGRDDDGEAADPDVEAGAPEIRRIDPRIGLDAATA